MCHCDRKRLMPVVILAAWLRDPDHWQGAVFSVDLPTTLDDRLDEISLALYDLQHIDHRYLKSDQKSQSDP